MFKDPNSRLPFTVDWTLWLDAENDEASAAEWIVPAGLTKEAFPAPILADGKATVWLSGGTEGRVYEVICRLTTTGGRIDDRTLQIRTGHR
jgi:hypothetical protein